MTIPSEKVEKRGNFAIILLGKFSPTSPHHLSQDKKLSHTAFGWCSLKKWCLLLWQPVAWGQSQGNQRSPRSNQLQNYLQILVMWDKYLPYGLFSSSKSILWVGAKNLLMDPAIWKQFLHFIFKMGIQCKIYHFSFQAEWTKVKGFHSSIANVLWEPGTERSCYKMTAVELS